MSEFKLLPDEIVRYQEANARNEQDRSIHLVLTNFNIIEVVEIEGFFSTSTVTNKYPLLDLKSQNNKPNVLIGKNKNGKKQLELYFTSFSKEYTFSGWLSANKWVDEIEKAYRELIKEQNPSEVGLNKVFDSLKNGIAGGINVVKNVNLPQMAKPIRTNKCPKCGAELSGEKGSDVTCSYCGMTIRIK